jgi:hypothetical protein
MIITDVREAPLAYAPLVVSGVPLTSVEYGVQVEVFLAPFS